MVYVVALLVVIFYLYRWIVKQPPETQQQTRPSADLVETLANGTYKNVYVHYVYDGDSIDIILPNFNQAVHPIRFAYIDAPEYNSAKPPEQNQPYGYEAQHYVWQRVFQRWGRQVTIKVIGSDHRYKRSVAEVFPPNSSATKNSLNYGLVKAGLARYYYKYLPEKEGLRLLYERAEAIAKEQKAGLWQQSAPLAPWDFRRQ